MPRNPAFNQRSDTMETGAVTETNWTTETLKGSENKRLERRHEILPRGSPSENHPFLLFAHILALFLLQNDKHK